MPEFKAGNKVTLNNGKDKGIIKMVQTVYIITVIPEPHDVTRKEHSVICTENDLVLKHWEVD